MHVNRSQKGRKAPPRILPQPHQKTKLEHIVDIAESAKGFLPTRYADKLETALGLYKNVRQAFTPFGQMESKGPVIGTPESSQTMFNMASFEFRSGGKDMHGQYTEVQGCEYVANIRGSAGTDLFLGPIPITGGTVNTIGFNTDAINGRLGQISGLFNEFQFQWIMIEYVPFCSVTQPGGFVLGYIEDGEPSPTPAASYSTVQRMRPSVVCKFAGGCVLPIKLVDKAKIYQTEYLKSGDRLEDCVQGTLYGFPQGPSVDVTTVFGQVVMHYNVRLYKPTFQVYPAVPRQLVKSLSGMTDDHIKRLCWYAETMKKHKLPDQDPPVPRIGERMFWLPDRSAPTFAVDEPRPAKRLQQTGEHTVLINGAPASFCDPPPVVPPVPPTNSITRYVSAENQDEDVVMADYEHCDTHIRPVRPVNPPASSAVADEVTKILGPLESIRRLLAQLDFKSPTTAPPSD